MEQAIANGLYLGLAYALVAGGFALLYGTMGVLNFAHGDMVTLGAYLSILAINLGMPYPWVATVGVVIAAFLLGYFLDIAVFRPLRSRGTLAILLGTIGISLIMTNVILKVWGPNPKVVRSSLARSVIDLPFGVSLTWQKVLIIAVSLGAIAAVFWITQKTDFGRQMRAVAEDPQLGRLTGINPDRVFPKVTALATALAALSGSLVAPVLSVTTDFGVGMLLKIFAIVIIGGLGSFPGALVAAVAFGMVESLATLYLSPQWVSTIAFTTFFLVLLVRPHGLFGKTARIA